MYGSEGVKTLKKMKQALFPRRIQPSFHIQEPHLYLINGSEVKWSKSKIGFLSFNVILGKLNIYEIIYQGTKISKETYQACIHFCTLKIDIFFQC